MRSLFALLLTLCLSACGKEPDPISIQVFPAVLAADAPAEIATGWDSVTFAGSPRRPAATYLVAPKPLFTEWNIIAFRAAVQPDSSQSITVRFNAYAVGKLQKFSADAANLKRPLAVRIDDRWADFMPLLGQTGDRMTLYGFTRAEVDQLQHYLDSK